MIHLSAGFAHKEDSQSIIPRAPRHKTIDISVLDKLNSIVVKDAKPDITFLLDISLASSEIRITSRGEARDRLEAEGNTFKQNVREGFLEQARLCPDRIRTINAMQSPDKIFEDILHELNDIKL